MSKLILWLVAAVSRVSLYTTPDWYRTSQHQISLSARAPANRKLPSGPNFTCRNVNDCRKGACSGRPVLRGRLPPFGPYHFTAPHELSWLAYDTKLSSGSCKVILQSRVIPKKGLPLKALWKPFMSPMEIPTFIFSESLIISSFY